MITKRAPLPLWRWIFSYGFQFIWHLIGMVMPVGMVRWPWAKKRVSSRFKSAKNIGQNFISHRDLHLQAVPNFRVVQPPEEISNGKLCALLISLGLDPFQHRLFGSLDAGAIDYKKVDLVNSEHETAFALFIKKTRGFDEEFDDVIETDTIAVLFDNGDPVFIYNLATHTLIACDIWDLRIQGDKIFMLEKGKRLTEDAQSMIEGLLLKGNVFDLSAPSRAVFGLASYSDPPGVKTCWWRDAYMYLWPLALALLFLLLWVTVFGMVYNLFRWWFNLVGS